MNKTLQQNRMQNHENFSNITIIGTGYVGLVTGTCLAELGFSVCCFDINQKKINQLQNGEISIYEPNLSELIVKQIKLNKLIFTNDLTTAINHATAIFIAVGTPQDPSGKADLTFVHTAIEQIAHFLTPNCYKLIIIKSTVSVGTCRQIQEKIATINPTAYFEVASNPEFLREGSAVFDFMHPDRIIIGINHNSSKSNTILTNIYQPFINNNIPILFYDLESSELIKYASNCFLATKIAFINELADLCENINTTLNANTDILTVAHGMGLDQRIGNKFLQPGPGFGGSCFPKDLLALNYSAGVYNTKLSIVNTTIQSNNNRISNLITQIINICKGTINNKTITILGIAFKANTDDLRDSVAITVINDLYDHGAKLQVYDPQAMANGKEFFQSLQNLSWHNDSYSAIRNSELIIILTEWAEFADLEFEKIRALMNNPHPTVIDFRNLFSLETMQHADFNYYSVGRKAVVV